MARKTINFIECAYCTEIKLLSRSSVQLSVEEFKRRGLYHNWTLHALPETDEHALQGAGDYWRCPKCTTLRNALPVDQVKPVDQVTAPTPIDQVIRVGSKVSCVWQACTQSQHCYDRSCGTRGVVSMHHQRGQVPFCSVVFGNRVCRIPLDQVRK